MSRIAVFRISDEFGLLYVKPAPIRTLAEPEPWLEQGSGISSSSNWNSGTVASPKGTELQGCREPRQQGYDTRLQFEEKEIPYCFEVPRLIS